MEETSRHKTSDDDGKLRLDKPSHKRGNQCTRAYDHHQS